MLIGAKPIQLLGSSTNSNLRLGLRGYNSGGCQTEPYSEGGGAKNETLNCGGGETYFRISV